LRCYPEEEFMDKNIAALLGAAAALTSITGANASTPTAPAGVPQVSSYADLLAPVPNAMAELIADDTARGNKSAPDGVETAQIVIGVGHHHHHHHHRYRRSRHHHHHSHRHHHHSQYMAVPKASV
jgi:hypothetical protein